MPEMQWGDFRVVYDYTPEEKQTLTYPGVAERVEVSEVHYMLLQGVWLVAEFDLMEILPTPVANELALFAEAAIWEKIKEERKNCGEV